MTAIPALALPGALQEIAQVLGTELTVRLARALGGHRVYVPTPDRLRRTNRLVTILGWRAARLLCHQLGPQNYKLPSAIVYLHWHDARLLRRHGLSHTEIAKRLGLSLRRVERLLQGYEPPPESPPPLPRELLACSVCGSVRKGHRHKPNPKPVGDDRQFNLF